MLRNGLEGSNRSVAQMDGIPFVLKNKMEYKSANYYDYDGGTIEVDFEVLKENMKNDTISGVTIPSGKREHLFVKCVPEKLGILTGEIIININLQKCIDIPL